MNFHAGEIPEFIQSGDNYQAFPFEWIGNVPGHQTAKTVEAKRRAVVRSRHDFRAADAVGVRSRNKIEAERGE
jgi:hypothetical protein